MMLKIAYWVVSAGSLGLLMFEAPSGSMLTTSPERGKVTSQPSAPGSGGSTVRGHRSTFIWLGGGYHGGK
ncbi:hypothetical protein [Paraliomyxa miuraensis]|uniref:hypothetical protein n=1 Tax=Paraliomyxa miuraensis TaxID=376150 RepID=UPI00224ED927|nr:hypothetical protein [Paraliomyxa miuraensis]MCX4243579.1 hypothetical protein [Paraliomyxa miuraensis]